MLLKAVGFLLAAAFLTFLGLVLIGAYADYEHEALKRGFASAWERFQASRNGYSEPGPWHEKRAADRHKPALPEFEE